MTDNYTIHTLSNGMRALYMQTPHAGAEYFGVMIDAGARDEDAASYGLAHFVEHTIFKGTERRHPFQIIRHLESVGGEVNAFTTKEETVVYSVVPHGYVNRSVDLIADLILHPTFPQAEIDRERQVVADEIDSYLDQPSELVADDFEDLFYGGTPLGHNILGNRDSLERFDSRRCLEWVEQHFTPVSMVAFYAGATPPDRIYRLLDKHFGSCNRCTPRHRQGAGASTTFNELRGSGELHQSHTIMGAAVPGYDAGPSPAYSLLTNIIGGPRMNSLLNIELRERRGLVYAVDAALSHYADTGVLSIYFGADSADTRKCIRITDNIISRLADHQLSDRKFDAARRQYIGQLTLAAENTESLIISRARNLMRYGYVRTFADQSRDISELTAEQLRSAAEALLPLSSLTLT